MDKIICNNIEGGTMESEHLHEKNGNKKDITIRRRNSLNSIRSTNAINLSNITENNVKENEKNIKECSNEITSKNVIKIKKKSNRCYKNDCNKKVGLMNFTCNCGKKFCSPSHLNPPESHDCEFDFKQFKRDILRENLPKVNADKLVRI